MTLHCSSKGEQNAIAVRRMQVSVQGVAILSLISSNVEGRGLGIHRVTRSSYIHGHPHMRSLFICIHSRKRKKTN